eukprot:CAMPEP_0170648964 /NCGR_PEP_ID=MMETSP0224-20130122/45018_1 /TAXON_ID=285029 /ORGANISM="Togula jolla, Strain CCCM 725" /LENGTH=40 /DNA_ID= /DNA_START= /DNA_END= /DNA_ORIENTATION=
MSASARATPSSQKSPSTSFDDNADSNSAKVSFPEQSVSNV